MFVGGEIRDSEIVFDDVTECRSSLIVYLAVEEEVFAGETDVSAWALCWGDNQSERGR